MTLDARFLTSSVSAREDGLTESDGASVGDTETVGLADGNPDGEAVGSVLGAALTLGDAEGSGVGTSDGSPDGASETDGDDEGATVGEAVGVSVGVSVGDPVGSCVTVWSGFGGMLATAGRVDLPRLAAAYLGGRRRRSLPIIASVAPVHFSWHEVVS